MGRSGVLCIFRKKKTIQKSLGFFAFVCVCNAVLAHPLHVRGFFFVHTIGTVTGVTGCTVEIVVFAHPRAIAFLASRGIDRSGSPFLTHATRL